MAVLSALGQARDTALLESVTLSPLGTGDALLGESWAPVFMQGLAWTINPVKPVVYG